MSQDEKCLGGKESYYVKRKIAISRQPPMSVRETGKPEDYKHARDYTREKKI